MGGGARGFKAAALVNGHIDHDGSWLHARDHGARDQFWSRRARDQHAAYDQFGIQYRFLHTVGSGIQGADAVAKYQVELAQAIHIFVQHRDTCTHAHCDLQRMRTHHPSAQNHDMGRRHTGHTTEQHAHATLGFFQMGGTCLHRHAPGDFAHGRQQRQAAPRTGNGLVGYADRAGTDQGRGLGRIGGQMQVGIQNLPGAQHGALRCLRLLYLDDHVGLGKHVGCIGHHGCARRLVQLVAQPDAGASAALHQQLVAMCGQLAHAGGCEAHAVFMVFDFLGYADSHAVLLVVCCVRPQCVASGTQRKQASAQSPLHFCS